MLRVYDTLHKAIAPLFNYEGLCISEEVNGETQIEFTMPRSELERIKEEYYIRTPENEFVIKEISIDTQDDMVKVVGKINVEELKGTPVKYFETVDKNPYSCISLALSYCPGGWIVKSDIEKRRTLRQSQKTVWDIIRSALDLYMAEMEIDAINKIITIKSKIGEDKGAYFIEDINLAQLQVSSDTYELVTRIYPVGKDGLTIASVNGGVEYVENHSYSNKVLAAYWEDNRYTVAQNLKDDALEKLEELAKPVRSYSANVIDLAAVSGLDVMSYNVGDTVWLKSKTAGTNEKHRIVSMKRFPQTPESNTCTLSTNLSSLVTLVEDNLTISQAVKLVVTQDERIDSSKIDLPPAESGLPSGGTKDQVLTKASDQSGDVIWKTFDIPDGGITLEEIEALIKIQSEDIQDGAITNAKIGVAAITEANISDAAITRAKIADAAVDSAKIADAAIISAKIDVAAIKSTHIENGAIDSAKIADAAITTAKIGLGAIDEARIKDGTITNAKIKDGEIDTAKIRDGSITSAKIGKAAISDAQIKDGSITNAKIADAAVDNAKIKDASITSAKIVELDAGLITSGTIATNRLVLVGDNPSDPGIVLTLNTINGSPQLSTSTIDGASITKRTIDADHIVANSITSNEIATKTIKADNIDAYSITADKLALNSITINKLDPSTIDELHQYTDDQLNKYGEYLSFDPVTGLTIGSNDSSFKTVIGSTEMGFYNGDNKIAYINGNEFNITKGNIIDRFKLGHYVFVLRDNENLSLVWED